MKGLFDEMEGYKADDLRWQDGRTFAYVYDPGHEAMEVGRRASSMYLTENGLDPTVFPSLLRLENEVLGMAIEHLRGGPEAVGSFTSGGTESIMLAVKAARDHARVHRPHITAPEILLPVTAHAAFHKAADYLGLKVILAPVDTATFKAQPQVMAQHISPNTIMMVGSAPSYPHGVIDPIEALGQAALDAGVLLHVDACVGGWLLPFFKKLGAEVPDFDLSVPGVTSISMDLHKYAFTPKGASVVLYNDPGLRHHQIFACANWTGYTIINPTVQSTRSGGPLAAAWAVMRHIGPDGYLEFARQIRQATARLAQGVEAIDGLYVMAPPQFCMFAFRSNTINIFHIIDEMKARGWYIQPQLRLGDDYPENIHLSINPGNVAWVEPFLVDLREATDVARTLPHSRLTGSLGAALADMTPETLDEATFERLLEAVGVDGVALPERMAGINELLNALPPALSEHVLTAFINKLYRPAGHTPDPSP